MSSKDISSEQAEFPQQVTAEKIARDKKQKLRLPADIDREQLLSELQVHQIELELQNKELRESQTRLEFMQRQYADLYNLAPIGYASLDDNGLIIRCNQTFAEMLGSDRGSLEKRPLMQFIEKSNQSVFLGRFRAFAKSPDDKHIDVEFVSHAQTGGFVGRIQGRRLKKDADLECVWKESLLVVVSDITLLKKSEELVQFQASHDALTGLPNRFYLNQHVATSLALARRQAHYGAMLYMDMDRFKIINDSLGHQVGDELLISFSKRLAEHLRKEDMLARLGGDEFVVLLGEQHHDRAQMANIAEKVALNIVHVLQSPLVAGDYKIQVEVSIGITLFPDQHADSEIDVLRQADTAMYQAKANQKTSIMFFDGVMQKKAIRRLSLESELREALVKNQFSMYYQPQVKPDGTILALEALIRWHHPVQGLVYPGQFISVAEETGLIVPIGEWVIKEVVKQVRQWQIKGLCRPQMMVSINTSARQLQSNHFVTFVERVLAEQSVATSCLALEITESILLPNDQRSEVQLNRLAGMGLMLAVDDFGTGYSSLSVLQQAPIGQLKIDRRFIKNLDSEQAERKQGDIALIRLIVSMARELGMQVVAEGVETVGQLEILKQLNCDLIQGYAFARPMTVDEVEALLKQGQGPLKPLSVNKSQAR